MLKLDRVCIPLGFKCNFKCKYCYRGLNRFTPEFKLSKLMEDYLKSLSKDWCSSVIMSGGEPLLYFNKLKKVFSYVPKDVHKKVMSNGSLLTQEMVDYFNENNIEFHLSHDGECTKDLRGIDVLDNTELKFLINQLNILTIFSVCTNKNPDIIKNYEYIRNKLGRSNFFFIPYPVYNNGNCEDLIKDFDYDVFESSFREYRDTIYSPVSYYCLDGEYKHFLFNVDLGGNVIDKNSSMKLGTVQDNLEDLLKIRDFIYKDSYCFKSDCPIKRYCKGILENASEHYCKCTRIAGGYN